MRTVKKINENKVENYLKDQRAIFKNVALEDRREGNVYILELSKNLLLAATVFIALSSSIIGVQLTYINQASDIRIIFKLMFLFVVSL